MKIKIEVYHDWETEVIIKGDTTKSDVKNLIEYLYDYNLDMTPNKIILKDKDKRDFFHPI